MRLCAHAFVYGFMLPVSVRGKVGLLCFCVFARARFCIWLCIPISIYCLSMCLCLYMCLSVSDCHSVSVLRARERPPDPVLPAGVACLPPRPLPRPGEVSRGCHGSASPFARAIGLSPRLTCLFLYVLADSSTYLFTNYLLCLACVMARIGFRGWEEGGVCSYVGVDLRFQFYQIKREI